MGRRVGRAGAVGAETLARALSHLKAGRAERADQLLSKLLARSATANPTALHYAGVARYRCGRFDEAAALLREATAAAPDYAEAQNSLGLVLLETGRAAEARAAFERAAARQPGYANAWTNLGNALRAEDAGDGAIAAYRKALALDPRDRQAHYGLARVCLSRGDAAAALAACRACLAFDPFCQNALATLALAEQVGGDREAGRRLYDFARFVRRVALRPPPDLDSRLHRPGGPGGGRLPKPAPAKAGDAFNEALAEAVRSAPSLTWEPLDRVTRGGAVTGDLLRAPGRPIRAFARALRTAIDGYRKTLVRDAEAPFLARIPARYRLTLIASILKEGGRHPPHVHEGAWLSGVYYVAVPAHILKPAPAKAGDADCEDRGGWLEFGRPDHALPEGSDLRCAHHAPQAGTALLFPSYFYHGTLPFAGPGERIGIAFDAYPEP